MTRSKGEGSVYKRGDGKWVGSLALEPAPDGKRRRRVVYGHTRREALSKLDLAREETTKGIEPALHRGRITVGALLDDWLEYIATPTADVSALTQAQYRYEAETRVRPLLGRLPITRLDDVALADWQDALLTRPQKHGRPYAPRSVLKARTVLSGVIMLARRRRLLFANPLELVDAPSPKRPAKRAISGQEAGRFLRAIRGHRFETLFLADLLSGCRRGEVLGWTWDNVDLQAGTVVVDQQIQRIPKRKGLQVVQTKSEAGERVLPLPSLLVDRLKAHRAANPATEFVFSGSGGKPLEPRHFNRVFKRLVDEAGLAPLTPHELRHSVSTILHALGVPSVVIAQLLGHTDPSVTLRWYSHDVPDAHREAMNRMDDYIRRLVDEHRRPDMATWLATDEPSQSPNLRSISRNWSTDARSSQS
jgi:integrase